MENLRKSLSNFSFRPYDFFFYFILFFFLGILLFESPALLLLLILILIFGSIILLFGFKKPIFLIFPLFSILGFLYAVGYDLASKKENNLIFNEKISAVGIVVDSKIQVENQKLILDIKAPFAGKVEIKTQKYPAFSYGDIVSFQGAIEKPEGGYAKYLEKESVYGTSNFANISLVKKNESYSFKSLLFKSRRFFEKSIDDNVSATYSPLIKGVVLGDTSSFPQGLKQEMRLTGTTHVVALSGYNIQVIESFIILLFSYFLKRKKAFFISAPIIVCFVFMVGAPASLVRAAIMSGILAVAEFSKRAYGVRNSLFACALIMVLINPKILVWDIGFQLSFFSVLGLAYISPFLTKLLKIKDTGFLNWKGNLISSISALVAVLGITIYNFSFFSPISILVNILILPVIPFLMFFGFIIVFSNIFLGFLASLFGILANAFSAYFLWILNLFSNLGKFGFDFGTFSPYFAIIYYLILSFLFYKYILKRNNHVLSVIPDTHKI